MMVVVVVVVVTAAVVAANSNIVLKYTDCGTEAARTFKHNRTTSRPPQRKHCICKNSPTFSFIREKSPFGWRKGQKTGRTLGSGMAELAVE